MNNREIKYICYGCDEPIWQDEADFNVRVKDTLQRFHKNCANVYLAVKELDEAINESETD